jgi:hypothetical protein
MIDPPRLRRPSLTRASRRWSRKRPPAACARRSWRPAGTTFPWLSWIDLAEPARFPVRSSIRSFRAVL